MDIESILKDRKLSKGTIELYKIKIGKLNDNKPIKNFNFLKDSDAILKKISGLKPNTQRSYIITVCSILKSVDDKKYKKIYDKYSKILEKYNTDLTDQTVKTDVEKKNWISMKDIDKLYKSLEKDVKEDPSKENHQNLMLLSLYYLIAPRRSLDFWKMKVIDEYDDSMSKEFNYFDKKNKQFLFNTYKTARTYGQQIEKIPENLYDIIIEYIKVFNIELNSYLIINPKTGKYYASKNAMTYLLNKIFDAKISVGILRKVYLTDKYGDTEKQKKNDATKMATSTAVMSNSYIKK
jgi:hypothetical protein